MSYAWIASTLYGNPDVRSGGSIKFQKVRFVKGIIGPQNAITKRDLLLATTNLQMR